MEDGHAVGMLCQPETYVASMKHRPSYSLWGTGMLLTGEDSKHAL